MTNSHPDLESEQAYLDVAYSYLDAMRDAARRLAKGYSSVGQGGTHQARLEREAAEETSRRRLGSLEIGDLPLCFGRLDLEDTQTHYVGRISVTDDDHTPVVIDWRAPVAEAFYRATAIEPMDVVRRRHFLSKANEGRVLVGIDDEVFDQEAVDDAGYEVMGEGALLSALNRERTGRMGDIVATIQSEQDKAIRAPLAGVLVVTGGAGTGKTAVALHRAAYLLYTYRDRLVNDGVLLIGPNTLFLRYIDQVLPALGEQDVQLSTAISLKPQYSVRSVDDPEVARIKGDTRMAQVIKRALNDREHALAKDVAVVLDGTILRLRKDFSNRVVEKAKAARGRHNEKRIRVMRTVTDHLLSQYQKARVDVIEDDPEVIKELGRRIRAIPEIRAALIRMWPTLSGAELLHDLFSFPSLIASAASGILEPKEYELLARERQADVRKVKWSESDLALIDEADSLLGPIESSRAKLNRQPRVSDPDAAQVVAELGVEGFFSPDELAQRYADPRDGGFIGSDEPRTFGHVVVDEAQDLSPMQWRMLVRRCPSGSMTVVGDFGQASTAGSASSWDAVLKTLDERRPSDVVTLSVNYRTPAEIMAVAHGVLAAGAPDIKPTRAVRETGVWPKFEKVESGDLILAAGEAARQAIAIGGTVAVVAPRPHHLDLVAALADVGAVTATVDALDAPVGIYDARGAKGLEFDHVIVVEPIQLVTPDALGLRLLYVVLTRATQNLTVVHSEPLPESLLPDRVVAPAS
jgi:DNA helicase IV